MPTRRQIAYGDPSSGRAGEFLRREWAEEIIELTKSTYISKTHIFGPARAGNTRSQLIDHMMDKPVGRAPSPDPSSFHILLGRVEEAVNNAIGTLFDSYPYPVATFPAFPRDGGEIISPKKLIGFESHTTMVLAYLQVHLYILKAQTHLLSCRT